MELRAPRTLVAAAAVVIAVALASILPLWFVFLRTDAPTERRPVRGTGWEPLVNPRDIVMLLPMDSIPPIDDPVFLETSAVTFLALREPVLAIEIDGDARAYPLQIMVWHEIVNDTVGGEPVSVTYCPLCNTGIAFRRPTVNGGVLDFGTSGKLYRSNLVMWDRQTESYWLQGTGQAVFGDLTGMQLEFVPVQILSWGDWRAVHPHGKVLSRQTGYDRPYGANPYELYDRIDSAPSFGFPREDIDPRLPAKARVLGVFGGGETVTFPYEELESRPQEGWAAVAAEVGGRPVVVFWKAGTASALDKAEIARGEDVGSVGAFSPVVDGRTLTFRAGPGGITDQETGSVWDIAGQAVRGPLAGTRLDPVLSMNSFWFDWAFFYPETVVFGA
jgi:hypothetical protein